MMRVRIGIVSWNTAELLEECLRALSDAAAGLDFDVVVVDNDSRDASTEVARQAQVTLIANKHNVGYARAMNQALTHSDGGPRPDVLIALNPDTIPPPASLTRLAEALWADSRLGLVVPRLVNVDGTLQHSVYRFPSPLITLVICVVPPHLQRGWVARRWWLEGRVAHDEATDIDWAIGAVHVIRADALGGEAPYCERWFMYVEDMDLCWRLREQGWRCRLEPEVAVPHVGNAAGRQAWGDQRSRRWWGATYDWYRLRRGVFAAWRWAATNAVGVTYLLLVDRARRRIGRERNGDDITNRIDELQAILPLHVAMARSPGHTFEAPPPSSDN